LLIQILCHGYQKYTPTDCFFGDFAQYTPTDCFFGDFAHWVMTA